MDILGKKPVRKGSYDVIVAGGGIAGVSAAVSAARAGAKVLLIEKSVNLGGMATNGLISWYEPLCDGKGRQMISGIAEELIRLSTRYGFDNLPEKWGGSGQNKARNERFSTFFSPGIFSAALDEFVLENGVELMFDTLITYPVMEDGRCMGLVTENINGREYFEAGAVVDATGSAVVMERAGVPTITGKNYLSYVVHYYKTEEAMKLYENKDTCAFRRWMGIGADMNGNGQPEGVGLFEKGTAEEITGYMITGRKNLLKKLAEKEKNSLDIMSVPHMPQLRTIRRIIGETDFHAADKEEYEDAIGWCGDFRPGGIGRHYQIPFGSMYHRKFENLAAAGRIISAPQGDAWEVSRVIPVCALTGEAAGRAAALCAKEKISMRQIGKQYMERIRNI